MPSVQTAAIPDRMTEDARARIAVLPALSHSALLIESDLAARDFTAYTLHARRPEGRQGDRHPRDWAIRAQRAEADAELWLAVQAEMDARR